MTVWGAHVSGGVWGLIALPLAAVRVSAQPATLWPPTRRPAPLSAPASPKPSDKLRLRTIQAAAERPAQPGLVARDGGGPDTPFTDTMLARNFERIALYDEYDSDSQDVAGPRTKAAPLGQPVRMSVDFGDQSVAATRHRQANVSAMPRACPRHRPADHITEQIPTFIVLFFRRE